MRGVLLNILIYELEFVVFLCLLVYWRERPLLVLTALTCFAFMDGQATQLCHVSKQANDHIIKNSKKIPVQRYVEQIFIFYHEIISKTPL